MSAIIGIRCDECGKVEHAPEGTEFLQLCQSVRMIGWKLSDADLCPFCAAKRKAAEAAKAKG